MPQLAAELVRAGVDVIFAPSSTETGAALETTKTVPVVFTPSWRRSCGEPRATGGNATGMTMLLTDLVAKELEVFKEALPQARRFGVLFASTAPSHVPALEAAETAARQLAVDDDAAALRRADQTMAPELLKRPVDVHRGHAGGVAELSLRNRHLECLPVRQADGPEAYIDLAQDMRDPGVGITAADIDHPLPKHRRIDERVPPEHVGDARVRTKKGPNHLMGDERHLAGDDRCQAVIHDVEVEALQVRDVARDMEGHDLASAA